MSGTDAIQRDLPDCINNDDYFFFNGTTLTCLWADMNRNEYCEKNLFRIKCPKTCGACNGKESQYSGTKNDVQKSGNIYQTCQWLMNHFSYERLKLCRSMGQLCPDTCNDKTTKGIKYEEISLSSEEKFTASMLQQHKINIFGSEESATEPSYSFNIFNSSLAGHHQSHNAQNNVSIDRCEDKPNFIFTTSHGKNVSCPWITKAEKEKVIQRQSKYCFLKDGKTISKIGNSCSSSCGFCQQKSKNFQIQSAGNKMQSRMQCADDTVFSFQLIYSNKWRKCEWLTRNIERTERRQSKYCTKSDIASACPLSCSLCDTSNTNAPSTAISTTPSVSPSKIQNVLECKDNDTFLFALDYSGSLRKCAWLTKKNAEERINRYCIRSHIRGACPLTCDSCSSCQDDDSFSFFRKNGIMATCEWLANDISGTAHKRQARYCHDNEIGSKCLYSCGFCIGTTFNRDNYFEETPAPSFTISPTQNPSTLYSTVPSIQPSETRSHDPSSIPSHQPSGYESFEPSLNPSLSLYPSLDPSARPSIDPTSIPSSLPSSIPSYNPTSLPSFSPSSLPSKLPSESPSAIPSYKPSESNAPSLSLAPTTRYMPSTQPSLSSKPSALPTLVPSMTPTGFPSMSLSALPSSDPSSQPSSAPSLTHSISPSGTPSLFPSISPSVSASDLPSLSPSLQPSLNPSIIPSNLPSLQPSQSPSDSPSLHQSLSPSTSHSPSVSNGPSQQSELPSSKPSLTTYPSEEPSNHPSFQPSIQPSNLHSMEPSTTPSDSPSILPSDKTSMFPSVEPSSQPSNIPSSSPSLLKSSQPSMIPSMGPSNKPSILPSSIPSFEPSITPSTNPSLTPSLHPSSSPSNPPSSVPSNLPSQFPSSLPSALPSKIPSVTPSRLSSSVPSVTVTKVPAPILTKEPVPVVLTKEPVTKVPVTKVPATKVPVTKEPVPTVVTKQPILTKQPIVTKPPS